VLLLLVFATMQGALILVHRRGEKRPEKAFRVPRFVPILGIFTCLTLLCFQPLPSMGRAAILIALGVPIVFVSRKRRSVAEEESSS
jgi:amino acid transporter